MGWSLLHGTRAIPLLVTRTAWKCHPIAGVVFLELLLSFNLLDACDETWRRSGLPSGTGDGSVSAPYALGVCTGLTGANFGAAELHDSCKPMW